MAVGIYAAAVLLADGREVARRVVGVSPWLLLLALALPTFGFLARFLRWERYLALLGHRPPRPVHLRIYLAGFALTSTPGKVGENVRALYLRPFGVPVGDSLAAFVAARFADLAAMVLLSVLALRLAEGYVGAVAVLTAATAAGILVLRHPRLPEAILGRVSGEGIVARSVAGAARALAGARELLAPWPFAWGLGVSLVAWGLEGLTFALVAWHLGVGIPLLTAVGVFAVATLLGAVSFLPGGVGPTEALLVGLLVVAGGSVSAATATMLLTRAVTLWWAVLLGVLAFLGLGRTPALSTVGEP